MRSLLLVATITACASVSLTALAADPTKPDAPKADATKPDATKKVPASAPVDLPPPPPPPWTPPPVVPPTIVPPVVPPPPSSNGDLMPSRGAAHMDVDQAQEKLTRDNRFQMIEARLAADEQKDAENARALEWLKKFKVSGYLQPQLLIQSYDSAASPNVGSTGKLPAGIGANDVTAKADGTTTNGDYFRLRRARVKVEFAPVEYTKFVFEIDPTSAGGATGGTGTVARTVEAVGIAKWNDWITTEYAMGIFKIPFGYEVLQSDADRPFIERSWGEQNMTPGEFDTGIRAYSSAHFDHGGFNGREGRLDLQLAVVNGVTEGEKTFAVLPDSNKGKDLVGRISYGLGTKPGANWVNFAMSGYYGQGQNVDPAGLRFKQFVRYAANAEIGARDTFVEAIGETRLFVEGTVGQNMDRGVKYGFAVPSIPSVITSDVSDLHEKSFWVRLEQDVTQWVTLGARWDAYTPDTSLDSNSRETLSFVAAVHYTKWLQSMFEYDHATDDVHRAGGVAAGKTIDVGSVVLQARF